MQQICIILFKIMHDNVLAMKNEIMKNAGITTFPEYMAVCVCGLYNFHE